MLSYHLYRLDRFKYEKKALLRWYFSGWEKKIAESLLILDSQIKSANSIQKTIFYELYLLVDYIKLHDYTFFCCRCLGSSFGIWQTLYIAPERSMAKVKSCVEVKSLWTKEKSFWCLLEETANRQPEASALFVVKGMRAVLSDPKYLLFHSRTIE